MDRVIVIGCPGAGKSTFSRKLRDKTDLPLYHLDMIWHRSDKTHITREAFDQALEVILNAKSWIIDGNYSRTMEMRLQMCDTVFFLDLPLELCLESVHARIGIEREDMPWVEDEVDEEFNEFIATFAKVERPQIYSLLNKYPGKNVTVFHARRQIDEYLEQL